MKQYIGTKQIEAELMTKGEYHEHRGWPFPIEDNPNVKGYLVKYSDGYISWSPEKQFEEAYRECDNMTFGLAIEALKKGFKVARKGWNGKGMFVYLTKWFVLQCDELKSETHKNLESFLNKGGIDSVVFNGHIDMKAADNSIVIGWIASQTDMLSEDWYIVE